MVDKCSQVTWLEKVNTIQVRDVHSPVCACGVCVHA